MCRTNGLKNIYESELNRKSKYYAVFDALLRHFIVNDFNILTLDDYLSKMH